MKLYYNPLSTYSQKVLTALYEKEIPFEGEVVNLMTPEGRAAFEGVSKLGKLPFLVPKEGWQVPESTSIIEYLEDEFPQSRPLIPAARFAARQTRFMDRMSDLYLNDPAVELLFQKFGFRPVNEEKASRAQKYLALSYSHIDKATATQPWLTGQDFTMADCAAIPPLFYAQFVMPFEGHTNLAAYYQRACERPSYARVKAEFEPIWNGLLSAPRG